MGIDWTKHMDAIGKLLAIETGGCDCDMELYTADTVPGNICIAQYVDSDDGRVVPDWLYGSFYIVKLDDASALDRITGNEDREELAGIATVQGYAVSDNGEHGNLYGQEMVREYLPVFFKAMMDDTSMAE